ncbi:hypothetical protein R3P38DRAFT_2866372, partial [Favolaschia claudopus]
MPARVRFASTNTFHSPPPNPPPLMQASSSSAASSSGPITPPAYSYASLPGPTPYPLQYTTHRPKRQSRAHPLLTFSTSPVLNFDVSLPPSSISTHHPRLSTAGFHESAVHPPQPCISLVTPHLPWSIVVPASNGRHVTVSDVFQAVYSALRVNVTQAEFTALGSRRLARQVSECYRARYERLRGRRGYREEKHGGVKRVDFLM